ncbi:hypothetical protein FG05_35389 [Fusarium graminearum]|nr:hypothetical protein FG05_35389 [Fusarium graminearum]
MIIVHAGIEIYSILDKDSKEAHNTS